MKRDYESIFRFVSILFERDYKCNYFLVLKGFIGMFRGMGKNFCGLWVCFFIDLKVASKNFPRLPYFTLEKKNYMGCFSLLHAILRHFWTHFWVRSSLSCAIFIILFFYGVLPSAWGHF